MKQRRGFILILAIAAIGMMSIAVTRAVLRLVVFSRVNKVMLDREQAKLLALSGVSYAIALMSADKEQKPDEQKKAESEQKKQLDFLVRKPLSVINRWHKKELQDTIDGIVGTWSVLIVSEYGKMNINAYGDADFAKHEQARKAYGAVCAKIPSLFRVAGAGADPLADRIAKLLAARKRSLFNLTELYSDDIFYPYAASLYAEPNRQAPIFSELFSAYREGHNICVWLLSPTIEKMLGLVRKPIAKKEDWDAIYALFDSKAQDKDLVQKILQVVYGDTAQRISADLLPVLHAKFEPNLFSVVSYGTYKDVTVKLVAVIHRKNVSEGTREVPRFFVRNITWIA